MTPFFDLVDQFELELSILADSGDKTPVHAKDQMTAASTVGVLNVMGSFQETLEKNGNEAEIQKASLTFRKLAFFAAVISEADVCEHVPDAMYRGENVYFALAHRHLGCTPCVHDRVHSPVALGALECDGCRRETLRFQPAMCSFGPVVMAGDLCVDCISILWG